MGWHTSARDRRWTRSTARTTAEPSEVTPQALDLRGFGLITLSTLLAASQGIAVKFGLDGFTPYSLIATRSVLALIVMLVIAWRLRLPFPSGPGAWFAGLSLGVFQVAIAGSVYFWALQYTPVGRATLITSMQPFLMVIAAHFLWRSEAMSWRKAGGLALGFAGVVLVVLGRGEDLSGNGLMVDGALLLAASIWASSQLLVKRIGHRWHNMSLVTAQMGGATIATLLIVTLLEQNGQAVLTPSSVGGLVYLATFGTAGMFFLMFYTIQHYQVSTVSSFIFLQPVFAVMLGWLLLGEQLTSTLILSMALVALGLLLVNRNGGHGKPEGDREPRPG